MHSFNFKSWLLFSESIDLSFDDWLKEIKDYAKPNEEALKSLKVSLAQKYAMTDALKLAKRENRDYLKLLLGVMASKPNALMEDYEAAISIINKLLSEKDKENKPLLTRQEIASNGWFNTGKETLTTLNDKLNAHLQSKIGKRQEVLAKKRGDGTDLKPVYNNNKIQIYHIPALKSTDDESMVQKQHKLYCKYGAGTQWCTAQPSWGAFKRYVKNDIYVAHKNGEPMYQWVDSRNGSNGQIKNTEDHDVQLIDYDVFKAIENASLLPTVADYDLNYLLPKELFEGLSESEKEHYIAKLWNDYHTENEAVFDAYHDPKRDEVEHYFHKTFDINNKVIEFLLANNNLKAIENLEGKHDDLKHMYNIIYSALYNKKVAKNITPETYKRVRAMFKPHDVNNVGLPSAFYRSMLESFNYDTYEEYLKENIALSDYVKDHIKYIARQCDIEKIVRFYEMLANADKLKSTIKDIWQDLNGMQVEVNVEKFLDAQLAKNQCTAARAAIIDKSKEIKAAQKSI